MPFRCRKRSNVGNYVPSAPRLKRSRSFPDSLSEFSVPLLPECQLSKTYATRNEERLRALLSWLLVPGATRRRERQKLQSTRPTTSAGVLNSHLLRTAVQMNHLPSGIRSPAPVIISSHVPVHELEGEDYSLACQECQNCDGKGVAFSTTGAGGTAGPYPPTGAGGTAGPFPPTGAGGTAGPFPPTGAGGTAGPFPPPGAGGTAGPFPPPGAGGTAGPFPPPGAGGTAGPFPPPGAGGTAGPFPPPGAGGTAGRDPPPEPGT